MKMKNYEDKQQFIIGQHKGNTYRIYQTLFIFYQELQTK